MQTAFSEDFTTLTHGNIVLIILSRNSISSSSLFEGPQKSSVFLPELEGSLTLSGLMSLITQMADMTSFTPAGGFFHVLMMVMSAG